MCTLSHDALTRDPVRLVKKVSCSEYHLSSSVCFKSDRGHGCQAIYPGHRDIRNMSWRGDTLNEMLDVAERDYGKTEALVTSRERLSYAELHDRVREFARGLLAFGVRPGDRIGVLISNRVEWFISTYAAQRVGATMVGLNTWYKSDELRYALQQADVSTLITLDSFLENDYTEMLTDIDPEITASDTRRVNSTELPVLQNVVVIGNAPSWASEWTDIIAKAEDVSPERLEAISDSVSPTDDAFILYSSGTTGRPKPIVLQHDGLVTNPRSIGSRLGVEDGDRFWLGLPLFFSFAACNESITAISHGATLVVQEEFDPPEAVDLIRQESCTVVYGMENMFSQMESVDVDLEQAFDSVRVALVVGSRPLRRRFEKEHGVTRVLHGYGLTEVSAICAITHHNSEEIPRRKTVGRPLANVDIRIKHPETGVEVAPGEQGEISVRSRAMFRKYLKRPNKTREARDPDGYLRTGDIGWLDADGRLVFEGRIKDMIITGGINVSPQEVERVISQHSDIDEVSAVGLPDDQKDEIVAAVVKPVSSASLTEQEVISFCTEQMASYKIPATVGIRQSEFPRTDTGKIRKGKLRESLADETGRHP